MGRKERMDAKALRKLRKYVKEAQEDARRISSKMTAEAMVSTYTAGQLKMLAPTKIDKMEKRLLKLLAGWSIQEIECLLVYRVIPEAKRRATYTVD